MERGEHRLPDEELARPAAVLAQRFIQRWDVHAKQLEDGRYVCIHEQLNVSHLYAHLRGEITLGTYVLNQESKVRFVVLDHDAEDGWSYLLKCGAKLAEDGIPAYLEKSRRGGPPVDVLQGANRRIEGQGVRPGSGGEASLREALKSTQSKTRQGRAWAR